MRRHSPIAPLMLATAIVLGCSQSSQTDAQPDTQVAPEKAVATNGEPEEPTASTPKLPRDDQDTQQSPEGTASVAESPESAAHSAYPCTLSISAIRKDGEDVSVDIQLHWQEEPEKLAQGEATVVLLIQPERIADIAPQLLSLRRDYVFSMPTNDLMRMTSQVAITQSDGRSTEGVLLLYFTDDESAVDFRNSGSYTLPLPSDIVPSDVVTAAVFKENDPQLDQMKSTSYIKLSNPASKGLQMSR